MPVSITFWKFNNNCHYAKQKAATISSDTAAGTGIKQPLKCNLKT
jgi:hypothetical protein